MHVVVADREDHGHFLRVENAFVNLFINADLLEFAAVTACVDQVTDGEDRVNASEFLDLRERVREKSLVSARIVVAHMNVADRGKRKNDFGFIECIVHERFLSACQKQVFTIFIIAIFASAIKFFSQKRVMNFHGRFYSFLTKSLSFMGLLFTNDKKHDMMIHINQYSDRMENIWDLLKISSYQRQKRK